MTMFVNNCVNANSDLTQFAQLHSSTVVRVYRYTMQGVAGQGEDAQSDLEGSALIKMPVSRYTGIDPHHCVVVARSKVIE
jgi:hypothetical protein